MIRAVRYQVVGAIIVLVMMTGLAFLVLSSVQAIQQGNRVIGCVLAISPEERTDLAVAQCFADEGLEAP